MASLFEKFVDEFLTENDSVEWIDKEGSGLVLLDYDALVTLVEAAGLQTISWKDFREEIEALAISMEDIQ